MDSDEKLKYSSNINEFDPDFRHTDKYEQSKLDKKFMKGHKRSSEDKPEPDIRTGVYHDPYNVPLKETERKNRKLNEPLEIDHSNVKREEVPTNRDLHHLYIPDAKTKQPKLHPCVKKEKWADLPGGQEVLVKHEKKETEIIHNKQTQFPGNSSSNTHHTRGKS